MPDISSITVPINGTPTMLTLKGSGGGGGGDGSNVREISWAEYRQLSENEKRNGTIYFVTDYASYTVGIAITHMPNKTTYDDSDVGEGSNVYDSTGLEVTFTDDNGTTSDVTASCLYTIETDGGSPTPLSGQYAFPSNPTDDSIPYYVEASYTNDNTTYTAGFSLTLMPDIAHEDPEI